jgi:hypothetical protein
MLAFYAGAVLLLHASVDRNRAILLWQRSLLVLGGLLIGFAGAEGALRVVSGAVFPMVQPPNARFEFHPSPAVLPGLSPATVFTTNEIGLRGDEYQADTRYNILAIGGSTTECVYLDDREAWTGLLQAKLNQDSPYQERVWVGNAGKSGQRLLEHLQIFQAVVPRLKTDAVIVLLGVNDFAEYLRSNAAPSTGGVRNSRSEARPQ